MIEVTIYANTDFDGKVEISKVLFEKEDWESLADDQKVETCIEHVIEMVAWEYTDNET